MTWLNWPNRITIARVLLIPVQVICFLNLNSEAWGGWRHLALGLFIVLAGSDWLDGYLARRRKEETPLGKFLDPVADKLLVTCSVILLAVGATAVRGFQLPSWVPVIAIGKDVITVIGFGLIYATTGTYFLHPRIWGKACTAVQLVLIAFCLLAPDLPGALQPMFRVLYWLASGLAVIAVVDYLWIGNRFAADYHAQHATEE